MSNKNKIKQIVFVLVIVIVLIIMPLTFIFTYYQFNGSTPNLITDTPLNQKFIKYNNTNILGNAMQNMPIKKINEEQCQELCKEKKCDWYNYDKQNLQCWLKQGIPKNNFVTGIHMTNTSNYSSYCSCGTYFLANTLLLFYYNYTNHMIYHYIWIGNHFL